MALSLTPKAKPARSPNTVGGPRPPHTPPRLNTRFRQQALPVLSTAFNKRRPINVKIFKAGGYASGADAKKQMKACRPSLALRCPARFPSPLASTPVTITAEGHEGRPEEAPRRRRCPPVGRTATAARPTPGKAKVKGGQQKKPPPFSKAVLPDRGGHRRPQAGNRPTSLQ